MDVNNPFLLLSVLVLLSALPDGSDGNSFQNCRKFFHRLQKRSMDGYHLRGDTELPLSGERKGDNCKVYELGPPPATAPTPVPPDSNVYYFYPMVIDVDGKKIYSAVNFLDMRRASRVAHREADSGHSGHLPGSGSSQPGERFNILQFHRAQTYVPPIVFSGNKSLKLPAIRFTTGAVLSTGFSREVAIAKPADVVRYPYRCYLWPGYKQKQPRLQGGRKKCYGFQKAVAGTVPIPFSN